VAPRTILWRRLDRPGHETARLERDGEHWVLTGAALFLHEGRPCRLDYRVRCDAGWRTVGGRVTGWIGPAPVDVVVEVAPGGRWSLNGRECPAVTGGVDLDLHFSPSTNLLPIRRLGLGVGQAAPVRAAWLRFPGFTLEPLAQVYRRLGDTLYRYESGGGAFAAELTVDEAGMVTRYPGFAAVEPA
jgi:hypothetical protein